MQRGAGRRKRGERERKRGERETPPRHANTSRDFKEKSLFVFLQRASSRKTTTTKKRKNNCWVPAVVLQSLTNILKVPSPPRLCLKLLLLKAKLEQKQNKKKMSENRRKRASSLQNINCVWFKNGLQSASANSAVRTSTKS